MATAVREGARTPGESTRALAASISRGDLEAATSCFAKDACLLTPDSTVVLRQLEGVWKLAVAIPWDRR